MSEIILILLIMGMSVDHRFVYLFGAYFSIYIFNIDGDSNG